MRKVLCLMLIAIMLLSVGCSAAVSVVGANINDDGNLILSMSDGSTIDAGYARGEDGVDGKDGIDGKDGRDGIDGIDGVGIKKAAVNDSGHLMIRLTDDTLIDTGYVIGADGKDGRDGIDGRDGRDGADGRDGVDGTDGSNGIDGKTPYIGNNGNWWIGNEDTGVKAKTTDFIFNDNGNGTLLLAYVGHDTDVVIPEKATRICEGAFMNNKAMSTVSIPESVQKIDEFAFYGCASLGSVKLPAKLTWLGNFAFADCTSLKSVNIPTNVATLARERANNEFDGWGYYTFEGCTALESVSFGDISDYISYPNNTPDHGYIGKGVFRNCVGLKSIILPSYITSIYDYAFSGCDHLKKVVLPEGLLDIGAYSFALADELDDDYIHKKYITGNGYDNSNLDINFPESLRIINSYAFKGQGLNSPVEVYCSIVCDSVFTGSPSNITINCKADTQGIAQFAIGGNLNNGLKNVELVFDDSVSTIKFNGDGGPYSLVSSFSDGGFGELTNVIIKVNATTPPSFNHPSEIAAYLDKASAIYVPSASLAAYKAADGWKDYADKIQAMS